MLRFIRKMSSTQRKRLKPSKNLDKQTGDDQTVVTPKKKKTNDVGKEAILDSLPKRDIDNVFLFEDNPEFRPNLSPKEVLQAGSFGGTYFRPIKSGVTKQSYGSEVWKELPQDWLEGLSIKKQVACPDYDVNVNKYKVKCGGSLQMWEDSNWIVAQDPYGWFQWYCRYFQGRRSSDDERQISRWKKCTGVTGRWRNNLIGKIHRAGKAYNDRSVSPVIRQVLLHWAYTLTKKDFDARVAKLK